MRAALILAAALALSACATSRGDDAAASPPAPTAHIAPDLVLTLPAPPAFPETYTLHQTVSAEFGERSGVLEAIVSFSPDTTEIVLTAAGGPRLATVTWDAHGIREDRALLIGNEIPVENILADLFVSFWPEEAVRAALPEGAVLAVGESSRTILRGEEAVLVIEWDRPRPERIVVRNAAFGYQLTIVSQVIG